MELLLYFSIYSLCTLGLIKLTEYLNALFANT